MKNEYCYTVIIIFLPVIEWNEAWIWGSKPLEILFYKRFCGQDNVNVDFLVFNIDIAGVYT